MQARVRKAVQLALMIGGLTTVAYAVRRRQTRRHRQPPSRVVTIGRSPAEVEQAWRDPHVRMDVFGQQPDLADRLDLQVNPATPARWGSEVRLTAPRDRRAARGLRTIDAVATVALNTVLHRFKALVEAGEAPTLTRNPAGRDRVVSAV
jgi:hypothetical protein